MDIWPLLITIGTSVASAILGYILKSCIKENKELKKEREQRVQRHEKALESGVVCILRKHLMDEHEMWTARGYITPKALEHGILMYKAYKDLGGNGMIDHMEEDIQRLPIREQ